MWAPFWAHTHFVAMPAYLPMWLPYTFLRHKSHPCITSRQHSQPMYNGYHQNIILANNSYSWMPTQKGKQKYKHVDVIVDVSSDNCMSLHMSSPTSGWIQNFQVIVNITRDMQHMHDKKKLQTLPVYKRLNNRFFSCHGWPSHPVVGSRSLAYFLMSLQRTTFIEPNGCPCASNSTCFFMPVLPPPFRVGGGYEVLIASLLSPSECSVPKCVGYPRLQKPRVQVQQTPPHFKRCSQWGRNVNIHPVQFWLWPTLKWHDNPPHFPHDAYELPGWSSNTLTAGYDIVTLNSIPIPIPLTLKYFNFETSDVRFDIYMSMQTS